MRAEKWSGANDKRRGGVRRDPSVGFNFLKIVLVYMKIYM